MSHDDAVAAVTAAITDPVNGTNNLLILLKAGVVNQLQTISDDRLSLAVSLLGLGTYP